jgi:small subunit ribosomal protein S1
MYEGTINEVEEKQLLTGKVVGITAKDVILNIGYKSDGLVSRSEFKDLPDLKVGDDVEVYLETQEDKSGQVVISRRKANIVKAWEKIQSSHEHDEVIEGFVKRRTKGGLIVDVFGIEAFLPGSQIDVKPIRDFDIFVGKTMEVKVVKINYSNDNVVVSHKVLIEKDIEAQKAEILNNLEKGQVLEGVVKNMTNFGVFIDLGGVDGLLHITDISWGRINHPEEVLQLDEKVQVVVLDFDDGKKRISLGMKQLSEHPWDSLPADIDVGSKVKGKIVNVADYGAFLELQPGVEGLIHVSEMSWSQHLRNPQDFINVGDEVEAVVLTIDREERKMSLGIKQLTDDPWTKSEILDKYAIGTRHVGVVRNLTNFGLFIELEEGIDGLVHVSDLSWTKKIKHPSEFVKVNDELEVVVMELDVENRRLALSHKHIEENPWDAFETVFTKGSEHQGTILELNEKGARVELQYGIEGSVMPKHLAKEDGAKAQVGETMNFVVLDFNKDERRISLSHTRTYKKDEGGSEASKKSSDKPQTRKTSKAVRNVNQNVEKTTLGELEALSALKEQMEQDKEDKIKAAAKKPSAKKTTAKKKEEPEAEAKAEDKSSDQEEASSEEEKKD